MLPSGLDYFYFFWHVEIVLFFDVGTGFFLFLCVHQFDWKCHHVCVSLTFCVVAAAAAAVVVVVVAAVVVAAVVAAEDHLYGSKNQIDCVAMCLFVLMADR